MLALLAQAVDGIVGGGIIAGVLIGIKLVDRRNGNKTPQCGYSQGDRERDKSAVTILQRIATILDKLEERIK